MDYLTLESKIKDHRVKIIGTKRANAVLIPLVETKEGVCLLFETRSMNVWQPGEVCFPGGGIEEGESGAEAAVRECCEELGVKKEDIKLIAQFDTIMGAGGFCVESYLAKLKSLENINIDTNEVGEYFLVPLSWLAENKPKTFSYPISYDLPEDFDYSMLGIKGPYKWRQSYNEIVVWNYNGHYIWGLSGKILYEFINQYLD